MTTLTCDIKSQDIEAETELKFGCDSIGSLDHCVPIELDPAVLLKRNVRNTRKKSQRIKITACACSTEQLACAWRAEGREQGQTSMLSNNVANASLPPQIARRRYAAAAMKVARQAI